MSAQRTACRGPDCSRSGIVTGWAKPARGNHKICPAKRLPERLRHVLWPIGDRRASRDRQSMLRKAPAEELRIAVERGAAENLSSDGEKFHAHGALYHPGKWSLWYNAFAMLLDTARAVSA
jgi:hypothetical protein